MYPSVHFHVCICVYVHVCRDQRTASLRCCSSGTIHPPSGVCVLMCAHVYVCDHVRGCTHEYMCVFIYHQVCVLMCVVVHMNTYVHMCIHVEVKGQLWVSFLRHPLHFCLTWGFLLVQDWID